MNKRKYITTALIFVVSAIFVYSTTMIVKSRSSRDSTRSQLSGFQKLSYGTVNNKMQVYGIPQSLNNFKVESNGFKSSEWIPLKYVCSEIIGGENISIPIKWSNAPSDTKSFVIIMYDTNPVARKFVHWAIINIPHNVNEILEGASCTQYLPGICIELRNSAGTIGYMGPCPPKGTGIHEYKIVVYALNLERINLSGFLSLDQFQSVLKGKVLAVTEMSGFFKQ